MNIPLIFIWVYLAMIAMSFWESEVEGRKAWDRGKMGWKIKIGRYCLPAYHFFVFWVMWPLLLTLPLIIYGWDLKLLGILMSAYFSCLVLEDFMWFVFNPARPFAKWNPKETTWYPWIRIGKFATPLSYAIKLILAVLILIFLI